MVYRPTPISKPRDNEFGFESHISGSLLISVQFQQVPGYIFNDNVFSLSSFYSDSAFFGSFAI